MKRIESYHCQGFVPMDVMMKSIGFVNKLVEVSTVDPLFGQKCCTNFNEDKDKHKDPECLDENETF